MCPVINLAFLLSGNDSRHCRHGLTCKAYMPIVYIYIFFWNVFILQLGIDYFCFWCIEHLSKYLWRIEPLSDTLVWWEYKHEGFVPILVKHFPPPILVSHLIFQLPSCSLWHSHYVRASVRRKSLWPPLSFFPIMFHCSLAGNVNPHHAQNVKLDNTQNNILAPRKQFSSRNIPQNAYLQMWHSSNNTEA